MTLDDITPPSNFLALKAIFRSMLPPGWTQRDGYPGPTTEVKGGGEYWEIRGGGSTEAEAVGAWWRNFVSCAKDSDGQEIVWRIRPELESHRDFASQEIVHRAYARLFLPTKVYRCRDCVPPKIFTSKAEYDEHFSEVDRRLAEVEHLPSGDVMAESP
jgi:hypothetical protein